MHDYDDGHNGDVASDGDTDGDGNEFQKLKAFTMSTSRAPQESMQKLGRHGH